MHFEIRRFYLFLVLASIGSALIYLFIFSPTKPQASFEHISPLQWKWRNEKYAYATFLGPPTVNSNLDNSTTSHSTVDQLHDPYFVAVRLLNYQIRHAEKTRTRLEGVPFLVLVLPNVPNSQVAVLRAEGATIIPIKPLQLPDAFDREFIANSRFRDVLSKLRLWQLTNYDKILYLDADSFLLQSLDGIFWDPKLSPMQKTLLLNNTRSNAHSNEGYPLEPPKTYLMAASSDTYGDQTEWEAPNHVHYLCACFMLLSPSIALFSYYIDLLNSPEAPQNAAYPEQDLLIYAHRMEGRMPWRRIPVQWSANDGEMNDELVLHGGVRSLHVKGWEGAEGGNVANDRYKEIWKQLVREMEEHYERLGEWIEPER